MSRQSQETSETDDHFQLPADERLTMVAYTGGMERRAFIEPVAVGKSFPDMPLFLKPPGHVMVPLEATYETAFEGVPPTLAARTVRTRIE